ncbi:MAG: sugar porter family MFS transporter [Planctomycetales bacterium]|nr:sugar porter family MFS transporter [Planctomycetales bacterium]
MATTAKIDDRSRFAALPGALWRVILVTLLGGFLFGYDTAVINGANQYLASHFRLSSSQEGLAAGSAILGCIPGAMFAGFLSDSLGRRKVLFLCAMLYAVSGVLSAIPTTFIQFLAARIFSGVAIGASSMICPVYIAEIAPARRRGQLGSLFQVGIVVGIFVTLLINSRIQLLGDEAWNATTGWRWMLAAEIVPALFLIGMLFKAPESPRWLLDRGRDDEAREILLALSDPVAAQAEIQAVRSAAASGEGGFRELFSPRLRRPLLVAVTLMAVSQLSGINAVMYYSTKIFTTAGVGVGNAFTSSVVIGLVNVVFTLVAFAVVDRAGRRPLLLCGLFLQVLALAATGWMFHTGQGGVPLLACIVTFIAAFAVALGPIPWILCSEIFPNRIRGRAMSLTTFVIWTTCYVVAQTFPMLNDSAAVGPARTFWIYAGFSLLGLAFVARYVRETKGKSLEEIEAAWTA